MRIAALIFVASVFFPFLAAAEEAPGQIVVTGVGHASAPPDKAALNIEVSRTSRQTDVAMGDVTDAMETVLSAVRAYGVAEEDIETTGFALREDWNYDGDTRKFDGYEATTSLSVQVRDLSRIGNLITTISGTGGVEIRGPFFALENDRALRDEARRNAVLDGVATARLLAEAAGVTLGPPILITDGTETLEDLADRSVQYEERMEEPMVMQEPAPGISETGVPIVPADIETSQIAKLVFRIEP